MSETEAVTIEHRRFGHVEVLGADVLQFDGIPGFPDARRFALLRHDRESAFLWLISLDRPELAFVVTDPCQFFPDYDVRLSLPQLAAVDAERSEEVELYAIVTVREGATTLNLAAPLVICAARGRGAQLILDQGRHSTREPLPKLDAS